MAATFKYSLAGKPIGRDGLGLMRLTWHIAPLPDSQTFPILKAALSAGMTVWNGADFYGTSENNSLHLINRYLTAHPEDADKFVLCIKSGLRDHATYKMDCSPEGLREFAHRSLDILKGTMTKIDIFGLSRVDPDVPVEESVKALAELREGGRIGGIQLTEVRAETMGRASSVTKIDIVEAEISLWSTEVFSNGVAEACAEHGIVLVAHTPLGGGILTGKYESFDDLPAIMKGRPRFVPENVENNVKLIKQVKAMARSKGCTPAQLALSWVKKKGTEPGMPVIVPVVGARSPETALENAKDVGLTNTDMKQIQDILEYFQCRVIDGQQGRRSSMSIDSTAIMSTISGEISDSQLEEIYQFAIDLGKKAGAKLMDGIHARIGGTISEISSNVASNANMTSNLAFEEKDNAVDIVTQVDEVERFIHEAISTRYPSHKFIGEETYAKTSSSAREYLITSEPTWCVDPLDGTVNYTHMFPMFCVSIAFIVGGKPVIGVIYAPMLNQLFSSCLGHGAWLNETTRLPLIKNAKDNVAKDNKDNYGVPPMPENAPSRCIFSCEWGKDRRNVSGGNLRKKISSFMNMAAEKGGENADGLRGMVHGVRSLGSATLDLAYTAMGSLDIWWEGGCWEWFVLPPLCSISSANLFS
uniref:Protein qutG n=1 Tax=Talaromyces marneffei PM1 TaxID=1077442 RepID=A0A093UVV9_TALMA